MSGPGISCDFVFAPTGVAARLGIHFEKDKVREPALAKTPGGAETGDSYANNDDRKFFKALRGRKDGTTAQEMAHREGIVDERAFDLLFTLDGENNERRAAETEKLAAAQFQ